MQKYQNIKFQMIKCRIIQYKHSTFQLGLQARNVNKEIRTEQSREEMKRKEKKKEEKSIKQKIQKEEKIDCVKERACILHKSMFKNSLNFKINFIVKLYEFFF